MDRTEFMSLVYDELQSDCDNNRANRIIDAADEYAESTMPRWIPVIERMPDISKSVLICDIEGDIYLGHRTRTGSFYPDFGDDRIKSVTAWMPLPEPYREENRT